MNPQEFLSNRIKNIAKPENLEKLGYFKAHPVLGLVNAASQSMGGPSLTEGFKKGVMRDAIGRGGTEDDITITLPPMPF